MPNMNKICEMHDSPMYKGLHSIFMPKIPHPTAELAREEVGMI